MSSKPYVSLEDIAQAAGVTRNTVSVALRNKPGVSDATRERIRELANAMGYRPNPMVTALMHSIRSTQPVQSMANIAFFNCLNFEHEWKRRIYYRRFFEGAQERCEHTGYNLTPFWLNDPNVSRERLRQILLARGIRGIIIGPMDVSRRHIRFAWQDFALATIGLSLWRPKLHRVSTDMRESLGLAVSKLRQLKYQRIGIAYSTESDLRFNYAWSSGTAAEFTKHPDCLCQPYVTKNRELKGFRQWLDVQKPDVIIDASIYNLQNEILSLGLLIPDDIGHVDLVRAEVSSHQATVLRDFRSIGAAAVDLVSGQLMRNESGLPSHRKSVTIEGIWQCGTTVRMQ